MKGLTATNPTATNATACNAAVTTKTARRPRRVFAVRTAVAVTAATLTGAATRSAASSSIPPAKPPESSLLYAQESPYAQFSGRINHPRSQPISRGFRDVCPLRVHGIVGGESASAVSAALRVRRLSRTNFAPCSQGRNVYANVAANIAANHTASNASSRDGSATSWDGSDAGALERQCAIAGDAIANDAITSDEFLVSEASGAFFMGPDTDAALTASRAEQQCLAARRDRIGRHLAKRLGVERFLTRSLGIRQKYARSSSTLQLGTRLRNSTLLQGTFLRSSTVHGGVTATSLGEQCGTYNSERLLESTQTSPQTRMWGEQGGMWGYSSVGHERQITIIVMFLVALSICLWIDVNTAADLLVGGIRAAAQLSAVGFAIKYIVAIESAEVACSGVAIMVLAAAHTASKRAKRVAGGFWVALWAIGAAVTLAFSLLAGLQVVRLRPGFVIPISGLVVGSSMTIAANTMQRLADDFQQRRGEVEAALALGASQWQASLPLIRKAVAVGFGPTLDYIKTYGVIQLPGAMVGMLMGGMPPQEAVNLQLSVTFFLLVPMALTSVVSAILTARGFFPAPGQLIEEASC